MKTNQASIVETIKSKVITKSLFEGILSGITLRAFATDGVVEEPNEDHVDDEDGAEDSKKAPTINYEDLIAKARREEKEKQYKKIEKLNLQVKDLTERLNQATLLNGSLTADLETAKANLTKADKGDSEEIKVLKGELEDLKKEKEKLEKELSSNKPVNREEIEKEIREELEAEYSAKNYRLTKLAELGDDLLIPELVVGNTQEEIDASIKVALERSKEIKENLGAKTKTTKRVPRTPSNPDSSSFQGSEISFEYLGTLDPRSKEYAEVRKQLGLR